MIMRAKMRMKATRIRIRSAQSPTVWYAKNIGEDFWAEFVVGGFCWKIVQEGQCSSPLYVEAQDCELIRQSMIEVGLVQEVDELWEIRDDQVDKG